MRIESRAASPGIWILACAVILMACGGADDPQSAASRDGGGVNTPPTIDEIRFDPAEPGAREPVRATALASDQDGDSLLLDFHWTLNGREISAGRQRSVDLPDSEKGDRLVLVVTASDGREQVEESIEVRIRNRPPQIIGLRYDPPGIIRAGRDIDVVVDASDPDGDPLEYSYRWLINGREIDAAGARFPGGELGRGDTVQVRVVASDGEADSEVAASPNFQVENSLPRATAHLVADGSTDGLIRYRIDAEDPDGDEPLHVRLLSGPSGMTYDASNSELSWTPKPEQRGEHTVVIEVDDLQGTPVTQRFPVTLDFEEAAPASLAK